MIRGFKKRVVIIKQVNIVGQTRIIIVRKLKRRA